MRKTYLLFRLILFSYLIICGHLFASDIYAVQPSVNNWTFIGSLPTGTFQDIVIDPNNENILYAATDNGLFKSNNGGLNWNSLYTSTRITRIAISRSDSNIIYASSFGDGPVLKSIDGGVSWINITNGLPNTNNGGSYPYVHAILVDPDNSNIVYLGLATACSQVWKTVNGGGNWTFAGGPLCDTEALVFAPSDSQILYLGGRSPSPGTGIFKTVNGTASWTNPSGAALDHLFGYSVLSLAVDSNNSELLYAGGWHDYGKLYKSTNGGAQWTLISNLNVSRNLLADPIRPNTVYYASGSDVYKSIDAGDNTLNIKNNLPNIVVRKLIIPKSNPNVLYAATSGGVYVYGWIDKSIWALFN